LCGQLHISITGLAHEIIVQDEVAKAIKLLSAKSPRFKERAKKGEISNNTFFRVDPQEVKVVDFSKGVGQNAVEVIRV